MDLSPQKFREIVFQLLFSFENSEGTDEIIPFLMRELSISKKHIRAAYERAQKIWEHHEMLDRHITEKSREYSFVRIKSVEKTVLRLAFYELLIEKKLTSKIIISEAHRIAKKFSTLEGASFVNAVLDQESDGSAVSPPEEPALA